MAKGPKHEPEVTDLSRYRKAKAEEAKRKPPKPKAVRAGAAGKQPLLGSNPRAGMILVVAVVVLLALWLGPRFL